MKDNETIKMLQKILNIIKLDADLSKKTEHIQEIPPREAEYGQIHGLPANIQKYLENKHIKLYQHQVKATELIRNGENILITTPTASGKTLAFNLPITEDLSKDKNATALYIYPAKALANDQLKVLRDLEKSCKLDLRPNIYDGDTPKEVRPQIRDSSRIVFTNPYMLHLIFSWHHQWVRFYSNLKYVVIDEAHKYRGVFGSNIAYLIRRLRRICNYYGSDPQFILSSATLANPREFSRKLVGKQFKLIHKDASPSGKKYFLLYNPYLNTGELSVHQETKNLFKLMILNNLQTLCFAFSRKMAELLVMWSKRELNNEYPQLVEKITAYRAGYRASDRRRIENGLKTGSLIGVTCTNALELGVDIGSLDCVIISGYPGTMISTWQQAGRAGRGVNESLVILVAFENPLDQYLMKHPTFLFDKPHENAVINLENMKIIYGHLLCSINEVPLTLKDLNEYFGVDKQFLNILIEEKIISKTSAGWVYRGNKNPASMINLDQISAGNFKVYHKDHILEILDRQHAYSEAHEGAVLINQGETYVVENFDIEKRIIKVQKHDVDYHTQVMKESDIEIIKKIETRHIGDFDITYGDVRVTQDFHQFKTMLYSKVLSVQKLNLPPIKYETRGLWFTLPGEIADKLEKAYTAKDAYAGSLHGAEHALIAMFPLLVLCDRFDIGGFSTNYHPQTGKATIFIYDAYEGGIGLAEKAVEVFEDLLKVTRDMVKACKCTDGCPSCIYSPKCGNDNKPLHKAGTKYLLESILDLMKSDEIVIPTVEKTIKSTTRNTGKTSMGGEAYKEFESPKTLLEKGEKFYNNGNLKEAMDCFQKTIKMDENNFKALQYQGMIYELQEAPLEAIKSYRRALHVKKDDPLTLYYLSVSLYNADKYKESKEISEKLTKVRPDWDDSWYILAISLQAMGDIKGAIKAYSKALSINPLNEDASEGLKELLG